MFIDNLCESIYKLMAGSPNEPGVEAETPGADVGDLGLRQMTLDDNPDNSGQGVIEDMQTDPRGTEQDGTPTQGPSDVGLAEDSAEVLLSDTYTWALTVCLLGILVGPRLGKFKL